MEPAGDTEGCKRCNCKKSKCLKLYVEMNIFFVLGLVMLCFHYMKAREQKKWKENDLTGFEINLYVFFFIIRYCECFAAGVYCIEPCSCQDCFNKPIHEDTVLQTRKQIESRNPLAFAPKVIRNSDSVPEIGV